MKIICGLAACVATLSAPGGAFLFPSALPPQRLVGNTGGKLKSACSPSLGAGAGEAISPAGSRRRNSGSTSSTLRAGAGAEPEVTVFDAEGGVSWEEYKKQKPEEYQVQHTLLA